MTEDTGAFKIYTNSILNCREHSCSTQSLAVRFMTIYKLLSIVCSFLPSETLSRH